jgi:sulfur carrier protein
MSVNGSLRVTVVFSPAPRAVQTWSFSVVVGATVAQVLALADGLEVGACSLGVWNKPVTLDTVLHDLDRIEVYRPLKVDPKVARRERFEQQGRRSTGLFARKPVTPETPEVTGNR